MSVALGVVPPAPLPSLAPLTALPDKEKHLMKCPDSEKANTTNNNMSLTNEKITDDKSLDKPSPPPEKMASTSPQNRNMINTFSEYSSCDSSDVIFQC